MDVTFIETQSFFSTYSPQRESTSEREYSKQVMQVLQYLNSSSLKPVARSNLDRDLVCSNQNQTCSKSNSESDPVNHDEPNPDHDPEGLLNGEHDPISHVDSQCPDKPELEQNMQ